MGAGDHAAQPPAFAPRPPVPSFTAVVAAATAAAWARLSRRAHPAAQGLAAFAVYLTAFVLAAGLPLARHLNVPNLRQYWTDEQFYAWCLSWWPYAVTHLVNPLFSAQIGAPHGYDLAWASTAPAVDLALWPVTAAVGVVAAYNILLLIVPPLSAWAAFIFLRRLTGRFWAALVAAAIYGFCPYELVHNWQGQPNLTVIALFPLLAYLVLRWWEGSLGKVAFVVWAAVLMAVQFYTFNEAFAEMTAVGAAALAIGYAVAGPGARPTVARLAGLTGLAYAAALVLSAPYLIYSLRHYQGALTRQQPGFSLPLIRLILPETHQMFGLTPLIGYSAQLGRTGIDDYLGIPLLAVVMLTVVLTWRSRLGWLLAGTFAVAILLAVGPNLVVTSTHHTYRLPWAALWGLPIARSAEPSRFIVFALLAAVTALARWLAAPARGWPLRAARWGLGLLAVAAVITDSPSSYPAVQPLPPGYQAPAAMHAANPLPAFITAGLYRRSLHPGEIVVVLTHRGNAGMLFQAAAGFYFRIAGGYINASLTPVDAIPHSLTLLAHPSGAALRMFDAYARTSGLGAILVEQAWADPWMNLDRLGFRGTSSGGVTVYPLGPWLAARAQAGGPAQPR